MLEVLYLLVVTLVILFLLGMAFFNIHLVLRYRATRGPDPQPAAKFAESDLPDVTVQLPVYNEGRLAAECLRMAAALDYPHDRLQIQFIDDSDDGLTSAIGEKAVEDLRREYPGISLQFLRRGDRTGFKAGALLYGTARARGEFLAIFDADFVIPPDFLRRTIHFFTDAGVGTVQARWDYSNHDTSLFTRLQADKLDAHQMFEQTARARTGLSAIFHGTAGAWRASALAAAGGWNCISEVEDVELTVRAGLKGWRLVYLDHFRLHSELPESINAFVRQQMRWKRGWSRIASHYSWPILRGDIPWRNRIDLLARIHLTWGPVGALIMILAVLPYFAIAKRYGLRPMAATLYAGVLVVSLVTRHLEHKTLIEDPKARAPLDISPILKSVPWNYLLLGMGMLWPLSQATFEGLGSAKQVWEVTPKKTTTANSAGHAALTKGNWLPGYVVGTLLLALLGLVLAVYSAMMTFYFPAVFYLMLAVGSGSIGLLLAEHFGYGVLPRSVATLLTGRGSQP